MSPRLVGVVNGGVFKPLGHVHFFPPGTDATGSRAYTPVSGATATPLDLVGPSRTAGRPANGIGPASESPVTSSLSPVTDARPSRTTWMDEHRHGDEGGEW